MHTVTDQTTVDKKKTDGTYIILMMEKWRKIRKVNQGNRQREKFTPQHMKLNGFLDLWLWIMFLSAKLTVNNWLQLHATALCGFLLHILVTVSSTSMISTHTPHCQLFNLLAVIFAVEKISRLCHYAFSVLYIHTGWLASLCQDDLTRNRLGPVGNSVCLFNESSLQSQAHQ